MKDKELMEKSFELFKSHKENFLIIFKEYLADQSIPLDERYELFIEFDLGEIGKEDPKHLIDQDEIFDLYEVNEIVSVQLLVRSFPQCLFDVDKFKEYCINNFIKGFKLD